MLFSYFIFFACISVLEAESKTDGVKEKCLSGDCQNGQGVFIDASGTEFRGTFVNGKLEGLAEIKFKNPETFSGVLHKDLARRGTIEWIDRDTQKTLYGTWIPGGICEKNVCTS